MLIASCHNLYTNSHHVTHHLCVWDTQVSGSNEEAETYVTNETTNVSPQAVLRMHEKRFGLNVLFIAGCILILC